MIVEHVATVAAYEAKDGTFSAVFRNEHTEKIDRILGFATLEEAKHKAQMMAWDTFGPVHYASIPKKGEYRANVWTPTTKYLDT